MTAEDSPYRLTTWPGLQIPVPPVAVPEVHLLSGETLVFGYPRAGLGAARLEPDFYLREFAELEADDPEAVLAFCRRWGPVGDTDCSELPEDSSFRAAALEADLVVPVELRDSARPSSASRALGRQLGFGFDLILRTHSVGRVAAYQTVLARALDTWLDIASETPVAEVEKKWRAELPLISALEQVFPGLREEKLTAHVVMTSLAGLLNPALAPFRVHLEPRDTSDVPEPNVYQAACLQLVNDITESVPYRRCANERCGRLFSRQRGRSESAHHRVKGVRDCSEKCARAQAQRELRRRRSGA